MINLRREVSFNASLIRNWLIQIFWWIVFFPGFFSADSFAAVDMARTGNLTNAFTASWALYVRIFSFDGHFIGLLTLLDGLILVYALTRFAYSIFDEKTAAISTFVTTLTPVVWGMGITLWHDIPMTSGLLLVVSFFNKYGELKVKIHKFQIFDLFLGSVLITFRPNGLPTLLLFLICLLIFKNFKANIRFFTLSGLIGIVFTLIPSYLFLNQSPINTYYAQEWMRNDISCYASTNKGNGFVEKYLPGIGSTSDWSSFNACTFLNDYSLEQKNKIKSLDKVPGAWVQLAINDPLFVVKTHSERNAYLIPLPIHGLPTVPFLHSNIEFKDKNISWLMPGVAEKARYLIKAWNALRSLMAWAGIWFVLLFMFARLKRGKNLNISIIGNSCLLIILFIFSPIPDGRYALFTLLSGQLALNGLLHGLWEEKFIKSSN
jgi:hypothetical protein